LSENAFLIEENVFLRRNRNTNEWVVISPFLTGKQQSIEKNPIRDHNSVAELDKPDHRRDRKKSGDAGPAEFREDVQRRLSSTQNPAVRAQDMHRKLAGRGELGCHRRIGNVLEGLRGEVRAIVMPPDPGDQATSEPAVAIPEYQVLIHPSDPFRVLRYSSAGSSEFAAPAGAPAPRGCP